MLDPKHVEIAEFLVEHEEYHDWTDVNYAARMYMKSPEEWHLVRAMIERRAARRKREASDPAEDRRQVSRFSPHAHRPVRLSDGTWTFEPSQEREEELRHHEAMQIASQQIRELLHEGLPPETIAEMVAPVDGEEWRPGMIEELAANRQFMLSRSRPESRRMRPDETKAATQPGFVGLGKVLEQPLPKLAGKAFQQERREEH